MEMPFVVSPSLVCLHVLSRNRGGNDADDFQLAGSIDALVAHQMLVDLSYSLQVFCSNRCCEEPVTTLRVKNECFGKSKSRLHSPSLVDHAPSRLTLF